MQRFFSILTFLLSLLMAGCSSSTYKTTAEGITLQVKKSDRNEKHHIRLQVVNDRIIRVSATPGDDFSTEKSLITVPGLEYSGKFEVSEDVRFVILTTGALDAKVNKEKNSRRPSPFSCMQGRMVHSPFMKMKESTIIMRKVIMPPSCLPTMMRTKRWRSVNGRVRSTEC